MTNTTTTEQLLQSFTPALAWFKGKAQRNASGALERLTVAAERGYWLPEDKSRSIRAALNKCSVAHKFARAHEGEFDAPYPRTDSLSKLWYAGHYMMFGQFEAIQTLDFPTLQLEVQVHRLHAITTARAFAKDFSAVAATLKRLDDTRPQPVFTYLGASPTVSRTLESLGLHVKPEARICPLKIEQVEKLENGKKIWIQVVTLLWPEGTVHGASRYHAEDSQCEACGHGIKVVDNWVPLILNNDKGTPYALWTGRDCCRTIFGIKIVGELNITGRPQSNGS
jgi:hypothetical protein